MPLSVLVDGQRGATAIAGVSTVTTDVGATLAGTKLRYQVDYGDGQSSQDAGSKHIYTKPGTFHVSMTATDAAGRTISAAQDVSVATVTGAWFQSGVNEAAHRFEARRIAIEQDGSQVRGTYVAFGAPDRGITGQLTADRRITLTTDDGAVRLDGTLPLLLSDGGYPVTLTPVGTGPLRFDPVPRDPPPPPPNAELRVRNGIPGIDGDILSSPVVYEGWEATFDATQSSGDGLSFVIDFGDGTFSNTAVSRHVVLGDRRYDARYGGGVTYPRDVRAIVTDRFGRVDSETVSVRVGSLLTGLYGMFAPNVDNVTPTRRLYFQHQDGTQLTGLYQHPEGWTTPLTATLSGTNHIHVRLDDGTIDMDGIYTFEGPTRQSKFPDWLIMSVRGGSADGTVVSYVYYDPY